MAAEAPTIKAIIFDLDNCLCAAAAVGEDLYDPAFAAVRAANQGHLDDALLEAALAECWHTSFDVVARMHGFSAQMTAAGHAAFATLEASPPLVAYADLPVVRQLPVARFLVTTGYRRLQESKVRALQIGDWFDAVKIDAIDEAGHPGKQALFAKIMAAGGWSAAQVMVVGDNPVSELAAGRRLGMVTVQTLRPGVLRCDDVSHHIRSLEELGPLLG